MPNTRKILIIDDDPELRGALTEQLSLYEEYEAVAAENGNKGVQAAKAEHQREIRRGEIERLGERRRLRLLRWIGKRQVALGLPCLAAIEAACLPLTTSTSAHRPCV